MFERVSLEFLKYRNSAPNENEVDICALNSKQSEKTCQIRVKFGSKSVSNLKKKLKCRFFIFEYKLFLIDVPPGLSVSFALTTGKELLKKSPNFPILRKSRRQTAGRRTKHHLHHSRLEYIHIITFHEAQKLGGRLKYLALCDLTLLRVHELHISPLGKQNVYLSM